METNTVRDHSGSGVSHETGGYLREFERLWFTGINKGDGAAHDVRLVLHSPSGPKEDSATQSVLGSGMSLSVKIALSELPTIEDEYGNAATVSSEGADPANFWAELTWRQAPNMRRVHRKEVREKR